MNDEIHNYYVNIIKEWQDYCKDLKDEVDNIKRENEELKYKLTTCESHLTKAKKRWLNELTP